MVGRESFLDTKQELEEPSGVDVQERDAKKKRDVLNRILLPIKEVAWVAQISLQTRSLTCARLFWLGKRHRRYVPGTFRFPFGPVRYTDAGVMLGLYCEIFLNREYEVAGLGQAPTIIDCGGNIGMSAIWFKQRYPHARITIYEADPSIADVLKNNVRALELNTIEVVCAAVGASNGSVTFVTEGSLSGYVGAGDGQGVTIDVQRLSERINEPVDLLKVDIEGSEYALIHDLCVTGKIKLVRHMICEVHGNSQTQEQVAELWSDLTKAGFHITVSEAKVNPLLPGPPDPVPFPSLESGKYLLWLYAWQL